jgi:predicted N-acetyltransferase YhbS
LQRRALSNQASGATRTFVLIDDGKVVAYYALASGAIAATNAPGHFRRNMPDPIPIVLLARLAVARTYQGKGLGRSLLRDAGQRVVQAAETLGIRGIVVHAASQDAKNFYEAVGFTESVADPMILLITLANIRAALA